MTGVRVLIFVGGWFTILGGWWARTHSDTTPRYSAGYGSGFSPEMRRFWGTVFLLFGVLMAASAAAGVPAELMH